MCFSWKQKKKLTRSNKNYHKMRQSLGSNQALLHKGDTSYPRTSKTEHTVALWQTHKVVRIQGLGSPQGPGPQAIIDSAKHVPGLEKELCSFFMHQSLRDVSMHWLPDCSYTPSSSLWIQRWGLYKNNFRLKWGPVMMSLFTVQD